MTALSIQTSQNTLVQMRVASVGERIIATLIDLAVIAVYALAIGLLYSVNKAEAVRFFYFPIMFYSIVSELLWGRSLGKKAMSLEIIHESGAPVSFTQSLLRWVIRIIDVWLFFGGVGVASLILSKNRQRLGDLASGTLVIRSENNLNIRKQSFYGTDDDYVPVFAEVKLLDEKDIQIAKDALQFVKEKGFVSVTGEILNRSRSLLEKKMGVKSKLKNISFLETVLKDYYSLH